MERKHIITISGKPGSGKSSTADRVAELLGYTRHSSGDMVRNILQKEGLTLADYNKKANDNYNLDTKVDEYLRNLRSKKNIIVDSRLGFYWLPESFKVYLDLDIQVATARIYSDSVNNKLRKDSGEGNDTLEAVTRQVRERVETERSRFKKLYNIDPFNTTYFDLVIDTSRHTPQTVALTIFDNYRKWQNTDNWKPVHSSIPLGFSFKNQY